MHSWVPFVCFGTARTERMAKLNHDNGGLVLNEHEQWPDTCTCDGIQARSD